MKYLQFIGEHMRKRLALLAIAAVLLMLYLYRLASLPASGAIAPAELQTAQSSSGFHQLLHSPLFLPLQLLRFGAQRLLPGREAWALRLPSVCLVLLTIVAIVYILRRWYGRRTFWFGLVLVSTSAWLLHIGRLGTNDVLYLAAAPLMLASNLLLMEYPERKGLLVLWLVVLLGFVYTPGLVWVALLSIFWARHDVAEMLGRCSVLQRIGLAAFGLLLLAPLLYGLEQQASLAYGLSWLGFPSSLPSWQEPLQNIAAALLFVPVRTPFDPTRWLGRLPLLDAFTAVCFVAGILFYAQHVKAERTRLLLSYGLLALLLCAFGIDAARNILVPLVYLVALGGVAYLLRQWLQVFPRNPLARRLGIGLICAAVALSCLYNLRQYFVAWPHNDATQQTFILSAHR